MVTVALAPPLFDSQCIEQVFHWKSWIFAAQRVLGCQCRSFLRYQVLWHKGTHFQHYLKSVSLYLFQISNSTGWSATLSTQDKPCGSILLTGRTTRRDTLDRETGWYQSLPWRYEAVPPLSTHTATHAHTHAVCGWDMISETNPALRRAFSVKLRGLCMTLSASRVATKGLFAIVNSDTPTNERLWAEPGDSVPPPLALNE